MNNAKITILSDKMRGTSFSLTEDHYIVGRNETADICIPEPTISGKHCSFIKQQSQDGTDETIYLLKDEGSTNGTRLNGEKLEGEPKTLKDGDLLQVGNVEILFENKEARAQNPVKTMTVINLDETGAMDITTSGLKNVGSKTSLKKSVSLRDNRKHTMIFIAIISVLGVLVLGGVAFLALKMMAKQ